MYDVLEGGDTGGLVFLDDWTKKNSVPQKILGGLHFANGMLIDKDEKFVLVLELTRCRLLRVDITNGEEISHRAV
jgi:sugar lactone lactonase YvrE